MKNDKFGILFLCTGNACRSQIAEGWAKYLGDEFLHVQSAGIEAHGKNPRAVKVMAEAGVDISHQESTKLSDDMMKTVDLLVTVCGHADEHCPAISSRIEKIHWPLQDPAKATGSEAEILDVFRATRDDIKQRVASLISDLQQQGKIPLPNEVATL